MRNTTRIIAFIAVFLVMAIGMAIAAFEGENARKIEADCTEVVGGTCITCVYRSKSSRHHRVRGFYVVTASYTVNGVSYTTEGRSNRPYEPREAIGVHYDPSDPSKSYTGTGTVGESDGLAIATTLCMTPIVLFVVLSKRADKWRSG